MRSDVLVALRVDVSSYFSGVRREFAPAGESLWYSHNFAARSERIPAARTFVAPNESNQSKGALHFAVPLRLLHSATCVCRASSASRTPVVSWSPHASLRFGLMGARCEASRGVDARAAGDVFGPLGSRRGAQGFAGGAQRPRELTSRRLSERSGQRPRSEFGASPKDRAPQSSRP